MDFELEVLVRAYEKAVNEPAWSDSSVDAKEKSLHVGLLVLDILKKCFDSRVDMILAQAVGYRLFEQFVFACTDELTDSERPSIMAQTSLGRCLTEGIASENIGVSIGFHSITRFEDLP